MMRAIGLLVGACYAERVAAQQSDDVIETENGDAIGVVEQQSVDTSKNGTGIPGYTTFRLSLQLKGDAANVYTIFGRENNTMSFPPAYQVSPPFGANVRLACLRGVPPRASVSLYTLALFSCGCTSRLSRWDPVATQIGGVNPAFFSVKAEAKYDSWLTVGMTGGEAPNALGIIGDDVKDWSTKKGLVTSDGAVFWMTPKDGPSSSDCNGAQGKGSPAGNIVIAQLTVKSGQTFDAQVRTLNLLSGRAASAACPAHPCTDSSAVGCRSTVRGRQTPKLTAR